MPEHNPSLFFEVFNEIGILEQLSRAVLEARLPHGLIAPHFTVLNHLTRVGDGRTPIEMARACQVPKTSMTHTIKGLEAHGLGETRANPQDGRSKRVWLTDAGRAVRADVLQALGADFQELAASFDMRKRDAIKPILTELRVHMDQARDG